MSDFQRHYAQLTDEEFAQVVADRKDLVPEAATALEVELLRRNGMPKKPPTLESPVSEEGESLEDCYQYKRLLIKKRFMDRFWYWIAFVPVVACFLSAKYAYKAPETIRFSIGWVILSVGYWLFLKGQMAAFTCPACAQRFGAEDACFYCGFRRTKRGN